MGAPAFSPGPWTLEERADTSGFRIIDSDGTLIDYFSASRWVDDRDDPEQVANARLIASAPDLFAALQRLVAISVGDATGQNTPLTAAYAALAKARGEA